MGKRGKWNRKRKVEERKRKEGAGNDGGGIGDGDGTNGGSEDAKLRGRKDYTPAVQSNAMFESYYALQGLHDHRLLHAVDGDASADEFAPCRTAAEKEAERLRWISSLRTILPASFRLGTDLDPELRTKLEAELDVFVGREIEIEVAVEAGRGWNGPPTKIESKKEKPEEKKDVADDGGTPAEAEEAEAASASAPASSASAPDASAPQQPSKTKVIRVKPATRIPYIPHAYQLSVDRRTIRRNPVLSPLHDWLKIHTAAGMLTRQETVSMIPPVVLDARRGMSILDMCAAPGSKTSQLLEVVAQVDEGEMEPTGYVVANDSDPKRAYMLVHQLRRMNSPAVFVGAVDAQFFPNLNKKGGAGTKDGGSGEGGGERGNNGSGMEGMFDRVLCDVPCSGDGTTRKNPGMWKNWNQHGVLGLHPLQLSIALKGAQLTKVGGYMCYSTCSMNPIENEAVVSEILRLGDGALELVDRRSAMPGLKARAGWTTWRVMREDRTKRRRGGRNSRERKDWGKKNNDKMRQRKREWEEKKQKEEEREGEGKVDADPEKKEEEMAEAGEKKAGDSADASLPPPRAHQIPPPSWDAESLLARAESTGLILHDTFDSVPEELRRRVRKSCFPPTQEEVTKFHLERCIRCLPHDMDTGGFFVALFEKVAPMRARARKVAEELARENNGPDAAGAGAVDGKDEDVAPPEAKKQRTEDVGDDAAKVQKEGSVVAGGGETGGDESMVESTSAGEVEGGGTTEPEPESGVDGDNDKAQDGNLPASAAAASAGANEASANAAVKGKPASRGRGKTRGDLGNENFIPIDEAKWPALTDFYGLSDTFPRDQIMARACGDAKVMYFLSKSIKTQLIDRGLQDRVTTVNSGLKAFERNSKQCEVNYRITQEGIHFVAPHMTKRKLVVGMDDFAKCIGHGGIKIDSFGDAFAKDVRALPSGSFAVALEGYERNVSQKMFLVMWKCRGDALNCLVTKVEMDGMKSKLRALGFDLAAADEDEAKKNAAEVQQPEEKESADAET